MQLVIRIMFDHIIVKKYPIINSQCQTRCFKEFTNFWQKIPQTTIATKLPFASCGHHMCCYRSRAGRQNLLKLIIMCGKSP